jgi:hypothetical protein
MERHEKLVKDYFVKNGIIFQQSITSARFIKGKWFAQRNDIFSAFDFMIAVNGDKFILIQVTSNTNSTNRKSKIIDNFINKVETLYNDCNYNIYLLLYKKKSNRIVWKLIKASRITINWFKWETINDWCKLEEVFTPLNLYEKKINKNIKIKWE